MTIEKLNSCEELWNTLQSYKRILEILNSSTVNQANVKVSFNSLGDSIKLNDKDLVEDLKKVFIKYQEKHAKLFEDM